MSLVSSNMMPLGTIAPDFKLLDVSCNKLYTIGDLRAINATVIMFICNHCPYVKHIQNELVEVAKKYNAKGVSFIAINSNDYNKYPDDSPNQMRKMLQEYSNPFPYLLDEAQTVAKAYDAACTPDFYLFDSDLKCVYRGQFDDSRPGNNIPVTGKSLVSAIDNLLNGSPISGTQIPSCGCSIKWK